MADNVTLDPGTSGAVIRTDDDGTAHWQYFKISFGADNTQNIVTSTATNPLPVALSDVDNAVLDDIAAATSNPVVFVDNAAFTLASSKVAVGGGVYQNGTPGTLDDNDVGAILLNSTAGQMVELMASTAAIGKLSANSGVDIGDVDILSIIPGTDATNLGKAEDAQHASGDVGVAMLGVYSTLDDVGIAADTDGDYVMPRFDVRGRLRVSPGALHILDNFNSATGWAAVDGDTTNLATTTNHLLAANALTFDKANTGANNTLAMIEKTITSVDVFNLVTGAIFLQVFALIPDPTNVVNVVIRLGSNSSNYNTWKIDATEATSDHFESFRTLLANTVGSTGTGVNLTAVTYLAVGFEFLLETNTLAGLIIDAAVLTAGQVHSTDSTSDISTQISSSNINLHKVGNKVTNIGAGNAATATQRVSISTDDVNLAAMNTSLAIMDDWDETNRAAVNLIASQVGIAGGAGSVGATVPRVTLASDDPAVASLGIMDDWDNAASDGASVSGDTAHDAVDAGEPVKIGAVAIAHGTNPTAVAAADRTNIYANRAGIPFTIGGHPNVISREYRATTAQTNLTLVGTIAPGAKVVLTKITVICDNANSGDVSCRIGFGATAVPTAALAGVNGMVIDHPGIAAGSGVNTGDGSAVIAVGGDGEELRLTCEDPAGGSLTVTISYYTIES